MAKTHSHTHSHAHDHTHDHGAEHCGGCAMADAEALCAEKGLRLTDLRRYVLEALIEKRKVMGAYDLIEALAEKGQKRLAPISVYRALDFLLEAGLAHKIESRNAFVACPHRHRPDETVMFLICDQCAQVEEASSEALSDQLAKLATQRQFRPRSQIVEMHGICNRCLGHDSVMTA
jgi:Fur family transcriptional regulator, zinc uptake regulator